MTLSPDEAEKQKLLLKSGTPALSSNHRVRLEMLKLIKDTKDGIVLTPAGVAATNSSVPLKHEKLETPPLHPDGTLRRRRLQRREVLS